MSAARTRFLRPSVLALLPSGLWALDEFHPVAVVLDPDTGALRRVVSWPEVPPPGPLDPFTALPTVHSDGTGLWLHRDPQGPLVRIDENGLDVAVWTNDLELFTCGPGVAWCWVVQWSPEPQAGHRPWLEEGRLLRVDRDGRTTPVRTRGEIRQLKVAVDALHLQLAVAPTDGASSGTTPPTGWVSLPWDAEVPEKLTAAEHRARQGDEPDGDAWEDLPWDRVGLTGGVAIDRHRWNVGSVRELPQPKWDRSRLLGTAHTLEGAQVRRWDLGRGRVVSAIPHGPRLAVAVARPGGTSEVLALDPDTDQVAVLLPPDAVDITELGWPRVTRPVQAESYVAQVHAQSSRFSFSEDRHFDLRTTLFGQWPDTQLEWTFHSTERPGPILRRRVRLFDELGRIDYPEDAETDLAETVESGLVPPAEDAVNGYLDL